MSYTIQGGYETSGEITVSGSKNAALPMIASALLFQTAEIKNVPDISDVHLMKEIFISLGASVTFEDNTWKSDHTHISLSGLRPDLFKKARATYYLIPPLLAKFGAISLTYPGGCSIGKRPIEGIVQGLRDLGYESTQEDDSLSFAGDGKNISITVNAYFSVGSTLVLLLAALSRSAQTVITLAAYEPHVMNVIQALREAGADIALKYDHTIIVNPTGLSPHFQGEVIADYIVSGTLAIIAALTARDHLTIHRARIEDLTAFLYVLKKMNVSYEDMGNDTLKVYRTHDLRAANIQTNIYPGFPTDLQSPIAILMSQAEGVSKIHEILFEGRLNWLVELENMRGHIALMNPHEAMVFGKTPLRGTTVSSWDLRSGAAMLIAGMIAQGETHLENVSHIERGYENFVENLQKIGAHIKKSVS